MATQIKRISLLLFLALFATASVSSASASDLRHVEGVHRKLLSRLRGNTFSSEVTTAPEAMSEARAYGPPGGNLPYHEDPPTSFTMTSVGELKCLKSGNTECVPAEPHPTPANDYPALDTWSSNTENIHTDYAALRPDPVPPYHDYPSLDTSSSNTGNIHTDYAPLRPDPVPPYHDYPSLDTSSSNTGNIHTDYASLRPDPVPQYHDYPPPDIWRSNAGNIHTDYAPLRPNPVPDNPPTAPINFHDKN